MNKVQYSKFQAFQTKLADLMINNEDESIEIDTVFGNELFQRMSDAAFEVFEKYDNQPDPGVEAKAIA